MTGGIKFRAELPEALRQAAMSEIKDPAVDYRQVEKLVVDKIARENLPEKIGSLREQPIKLLETEPARGKRGSGKRNVFRVFVNIESANLRALEHFSLAVRKIVLRLALSSLFERHFVPEVRALVNGSAGEVGGPLISSPKPFQEELF